MQKYKTRQDYNLSVHMATVKHEKSQGNIINDITAEKSIWGRY